MRLTLPIVIVFGKLKSRLDLKYPTRNHDRFMMVEHAASPFVEWVAGADLRLAAVPPRRPTDSPWCLSRSIKHRGSFCSAALFHSRISLRIHPQVNAITKSNLFGKDPLARPCSIGAQREEMRAGLPYFVIALLLGAGYPRPALAFSHGQRVIAFPNCQPSHHTAAATVKPQPGCPVASLPAAAPSLHALRDTFTSNPPSPNTHRIERRRCERQRSQYHLPSP